MKKNVADVIVNTLDLIEVKFIYGIVGDSLNGISNALLKNKNIQWVHARHEEVAEYAADAKAQLTGQFAVCAGSLPR